MSENDAAFRYGNFEVLARADGAPELLGGGSFGKTYKARHVFLDQIVALKVISEKFAHDKNAKQRFLREARVVHGLRHPHIAQVIDFGEANNTLYYAMEYCEGGSLEDLVKRTGPLDPTTILLLARQLSEALECSHRHGFIHRDVKPANVMLADRSESLALKLVDFGLVKPLVQDNERMAALTLDGQNFFTPLFASPEQVMEEELDARSDLFSLGMTLWYLLKGAAPETGSTAVIMAKRLSVDSYQAQLPPTLPSKLRFVLQKLLEKDKAHRFGTASEVLEALRSDDPTANAQAPAGQPAVVAPATEEDGSDPGATLAFETQPAPTRLADKYRIAEKVGRSSLGNIYRATKVRDAVPLSVTVLDDALRDNPERIERLRAAVKQVAQTTHEAICQVYGLETFDDAEVLVREWNAGISLQNVVKSRGSIPFAEAVLPLRTIAAGVDFAATAGLNGVRLTPDEIYLQPADGSLEFADPTALLTTGLRQWPPFRIRLTPILLEDEAAQDISMTLSAQSAGSPRVEFGSLLYRLVAGMQVKFAARVNRSSYIRTSGLSEEGNWILSGCIADEAVGGEGCAGMLQALQRTEGVSDHDTATVTTARQPGSTGRVASVKTDGMNPTRTVQTSAAQHTSASTSAPPLPDPVAVSPQSPENAPILPSAAVPPPIPPVESASTIPPPIPNPRDAGPLSKSFPLVPILVGLVVAFAVLGAVALFLIRSRPSKDEHEKPVQRPPTPAPTVAVSTPSPTAMPTAALVVAPIPTPATPTPPPAPIFVLRNASRLTNASYELAGRPVTPDRRGSDLVFPLEASGGSPGDLVVKVPGYKPVQLAVADGANAEMPSTLERESVAVYLSFKSRETDYSYIAFSFTGALPGETVKGPGDLTFSLKNASSGTKLELFTGVYDYTLYGADKQQDVRILPMKGTVTVRTQGRIEVNIPPTFAGRFRGEFDDDKKHGHVARTIVLNPGLTEGHVDEQYSVGGKPSDKPVENVPLTEIRLDTDGILRAHIRYAGYHNAAVHNYDELFELRYAPTGGLVMTGGREMMPNDPVMRSELEKKLKDKPPMQSNRPGETEMHPVN